VTVARCSQPLPPPRLECHRLPNRVLGSSDLRADAVSEQPGEPGRRDPQGAPSERSLGRERWMGGQPCSDRGARAAGRTGSGTDLVDAAMGMEKKGVGWGLVRSRWARQRRWRPRHGGGPRHRRVTPSVTITAFGEVVELRVDVAGKLADRQPSYVMAESACASANRPERPCRGARGAVELRGATALRAYPVVATARHRPGRAARPARWAA